MKRRINLTLPVALLVTVFGLPASAITNPTSLTAESHVSLFSRLSTDADRDRDGLVGPVRRVRTETVKLANKGGKTVEGQRAVMEVVAYDIKGNKTENAYFPVAGATLTGKEVYKYDDKGNIVEMTQLNADGSLLSKEVYTYEFDNFGNWTKMTTSVAVIESGKLSYEPTEVTYRMISYYLDEATLARMTQPAATAPAPSGVTAAQQNSSAVPQASKPITNAAQLASVAANKSAAPLPSGASLVKTNMGTSDSALRMLGNVASNSAVKIEDEPPPVAKAAPKPLLKPITGGVLNGKALVLPKPGYPSAAKSARLSGIVVVEVVIDESGKVIAAKASSGHSLLRQAAVQAAQGARFSPTLLSGQPVKVSGEINYNFALSQ
ncbi:MAG: periplasmic protein TonB [Acidobacteriota bacterium]|jgi:TonB family protein|nr:periplasmic protein TonB [Acidobacteriota bacterium]